MPNSEIFNSRKGLAALSVLVRLPLDVSLFELESQCTTLNIYVIPAALRAGMLIKIHTIATRCRISVTEVIVMHGAQLFFQDTLFSFRLKPHLLLQSRKTKQRCIQRVRAK